MYIHTCVCIYTHTHIYTYICIYTYIYIYTPTARERVRVRDMYLSLYLYLYLRRIYRGGFTKFTRGVMSALDYLPLRVTVSFTYELGVYPGLTRNSPSALF